ncbi:transcription termination factor MTERF6, chloroplastic/mitochondrial-like [Malania oleifera]|uniref:transcription termination factor MTERF6, chloroplastic/mitochondrial-like n=1 Tax=Malania oleifera TaxID=397392 RepID=UPI0025AE5980|nr:transcription termination factor MTERF6, chloroplastic/mitochondrial-like [Malania oleifera]
MFVYLCRTLINLRTFYGDLASQSCVLQQPWPFLTRSISSRTSHQHSFAASYLINTFRFSQEAAVKATKYVNFDSSEGPDSAIAFFESKGFSRNQISSLIRKVPRILVSYNPEKILLPKFQFMYSIGISSSDLARTVTSYPDVLRRSLEKQLIPSVNFLRDLLRSDERVVLAFRRFPDIFAHDLSKNVEPNVKILRECGVPESNIADLVTWHPRAILEKNDSFREVVNSVRKMGFNPSKGVFVLAVNAMASMSKKKWEKKMEAYRSWGWSEEDILVAFGKHPWCMITSEDKIMAVMDFFVNTMGWDSYLISRNPIILTLSLKKRIIPRCLVFHALLSKGLYKKELRIHALLNSPEEYFLKRFVTCHEKEAPQLLKLYKKKLNCPT